MANLLKLKRSAVAGKVPTTTDLGNLGEVGLNTNDGRLFMREDDGTARIHELSAPRTFKAACRVATTANITLSGAQTIDGVAVVAGDRVLVKNQTTGANNGIYECATGSWTRALDFDASNDVAAGAFTVIREGTANNDTVWVLTTNASITLGTTALAFSQIGGGAGSGDVVAANNNAFTGANTFTNTTGQIFRQASTQDGVLLRGRAGGTTSYTVEIIPTTLAGNRTLTLPDASTTVVGTDATQTLTNKTLTDPVITGTILEDVFTITDGAAFEVDPANGSIQLITLGASRTPKATNFVAGESLLLMVDDGTAYTLTWTDTTWGTSGVKWVGGTAPTLATTGYTVIEFWKVSTQVYGAKVGNA